MFGWYMGTSPRPLTELPGWEGIWDNTTQNRGKDSSYWCLAMEMYKHVTCTTHFDELCSSAGRELYMILSCCLNCRNPFRADCIKCHIKGWFESGFLNPTTGHPKTKSTASFKQVTILCTILYVPGSKSHWIKWILLLSRPILGCKTHYLK